MNIRLKSLIAAHKLFPISLKGDATIDDDAEIELSCVINFYKRSNLLRNILSCLREQDLPTEKFEVILVEDRGGTNEGRVIFEEFSTYLNLRYFTITENFGKMGYSRNFGLSKSSGRFILFLDDDTVILQRNFLSYLLEAFDISRADAIIPQGNASQCLLKGRYSFHDPHFPTNRCTAYRRDVLKDLGGFNSDITGQEDVEFYVRFIVSGKKGGESIQKECDEIGSIPLGESVITDGGNLKAKYVFHAAGMHLWGRVLDQALRDSTRNSLKRASEKGLETIAFPAIGTGVGGFPLDESAKIMIDTVSEFLKHRKSFGV